MFIVYVICLPVQNLLQKHTFIIMAIDLSNVQICMLKSKISILLRFESMVGFILVSSRPLFTMNVSSVFENR